MFNYRFSKHNAPQAERSTSFTSSAFHAPGITRLCVIATLQVTLLASCDSIPGLDPYAGKPATVTATAPAAPSDLLIAEATGETEASVIQDTAPTAATFVPGRLIIKFKPGTTADASQQVLTAANASVVGEIRELGVTIIEPRDQSSESALKAALEQEPQIEYVEFDRVHAPANITPNDYWYFGQWHLARIGAPLAWATTTGSSDIIIAICDTGVDASHPDLASKMVPGWNVYNDSADTSDATGHGTAVAGIAAAAGNNTIGVASVAWGSKIMPIRIGSSTGSTSSSIIANGIVWAADHGARVVNVSFGILGSAVVSNAAQYLEARGGVMISSSGNEGLYFDFPNDPYVLTVGATDINDVKAPSSNFGTFVDLVAPGVGIYTTARGGGYAAASGTSFAAPAASGIAALILSVNPNLTPAQVREILSQSCDDLGEPGWDAIYSSGRVNAGQAVAYASATLEPEPDVDTTVPTVSFIAPVADATVLEIVSVQVSADDNVAVASVELYVDGVLYATDTAAPYDFDWNTAGSANGLHSLEARAKDAAGNVSVQTISVVVGNPMDLVAPTVTIVWPLPGSWVDRVVSVKVNASDDVAVARVELYVDGVIKNQSTTSPFSTIWKVWAVAPGAHSIMCKVYDAAGNVGQSPTVTVYKAGYSLPSNQQ